MGEKFVHSGGRGSSMPSHQEGATIVEFAIVLPLFLLVTLGILEFGRFTSSRAQVESAMRRAGEYGATLAGDCLTPASDRFFEFSSVLEKGAQLTLSGEVVPFTDEVHAIRLTVTGSVPSLLAGRGFAMRLIGFFPIEMPRGCMDKMTIVATSASNESNRSSRVTSGP